MKKSWPIIAVSLWLNLWSSPTLADEPGQIPSGVCERHLYGQVEIFSVRGPAQGIIPDFPDNIRKIFVPNFEKTTFEGIKLAITNLMRRYPEKQIAAYIPVRKYTPEEATELLQFFQLAGVHELVILAGGKFADAETRGAFPDTASFLRQMDLKSFGIDTIGIAAHPEYHRHMNAAERFRALRIKYNLAKSLGLSLYLITNVVANPAKFVLWQRAVRAMGIDSKIYFGTMIPEMSPADYQKFTVHLCEAIPTDPNHLEYDTESWRRIHTPGENDLPKMMSELASMGASVEGLHFYLYGENAQAGLNALAR